MRPGRVRPAWLQRLGWCTLCNMTDELVRRMRHLVSLNDPRHGGPYGGSAAQDFVETMTKAADRIEELERWKAEATFLLSGWEGVWEALGRPGPVGRWKWDNCIAEIEELKKDITR